MEVHKFSKSFPFAHSFPVSFQKWIVQNEKLVRIIWSPWWLSFPHVEINKFACVHITKSTSRQTTAEASQTPKRVGVEKKNLKRFTGIKSVNNRMSTVFHSCTHTLYTCIYFSLTGWWCCCRVNIHFFCHHFNPQWEHEIPPESTFKWNKQHKKIII